MRLWVKLFLFFSAYLPLFYILAIKNWYNRILFGVCILLTVLSAITWYGLLWQSKRYTASQREVVYFEDKLKESLTYLIPYIVSFLNFNLDRWQDWASLVLLMLVIFLVYANSELIFVNPILSGFRYKIYYTELRDPIIQSRTTCILITKRKKKLKVNDLIGIRNLADEVYVEVLEREEVQENEA
ncbi:MAG TPA: hypothetical protein ENI32_06020 [Candidatus Syntrophoarchaeum butanivorans]|uniref:Uncharacterized protein n=1 Tax=Candidatus Syntropharchaeum butanivorans TaxID=1839936 RepID=A0A7J2S3Y1_9EURY|nr:hypothetical protein [Candidatus Syntrophoarchaeum butanivorans]